LTRTQLRCLADWLPVLEAPGFNPGEWRGGDADADGVIHMPWFEYSEGLAAWPGPCAESLIVVGFDWMTWLQTAEGASLAGDVGAIARASSTDLARLVTAIRRGDRFVEGNIAGAFASGVLAAISRRASALLGRPSARSPDRPSTRSS
jgi:hypothetical protein